MIDPRHAFWLAGFRPFFALACLAGALLPLLWLAIYSGRWVPAFAQVSVHQWHAHEMFYGFGWAVLGGFLLTATKNWVGVRGYHGRALQGLFLAWLLERAGMLWQAVLPGPLFLVSNVLFLVAIVSMLLATLLRHRSSDSYRHDNWVFLLILPAFLPAKLLLLDAAMAAQGELMTLALFRLAFLVMLERTLMQFMKGAFQVEIHRQPRIEAAIRGLAIALVAQPWLPPVLAAVLAGLLALLLLVRLHGWHPLRALRRLDIGIMVLGYLAIVAQLLLVAVAVLPGVTWVGALTVHVFSFGAMGLIVPAMLLRIAKGHTGRKVVFTAGDRGLLWLMITAFALRNVMPQLAPQAYLYWIGAAGLAWSLCFVLLGVRIVPMLLMPRVDGKEH